MDANWHLDKFFAKMTKEEIKFLSVVFRQIYLSIQRVNDAGKEAYFSFFAKLRIKSKTTKNNVISSYKED